MRKIAYAGTAFYTGDALAEVLMEYARALARHGVADTVFVPGRTPQGERDRIEVLIGPASQIVSEPVDIDGPEIEDAGLVEELHGLTSQLAPRRPSAERAGGDPQRNASFDELG